MTYSDVSLMIDGAWTKGANGRTIPVINPATEEVIGQVAHAEKAISTARSPPPTRASSSGARSRPTSATRSCARPPT